MKIAVRYYTKTGNTKRLAEVFAKAAGTEALPISVPVDEPVDILFLGNSYYAFNIDPEVREFILSLDKEKIGRIVNFGSAAMLNSTYKKVKAEADKVGIPVDDREFHCKGEFKVFHKGRPNDKDLNAAAIFARSFIPPESAEKKAEQYTLTYESNGGSDVTDAEYDKGTEVQLTAEPERNGYTFTGWYSDPTLINRITSVKMNGNKTVYAGWESENPYNGR